MMSLDELYLKGPVIAVERNPSDIWQVTSISGNAVETGFFPTCETFDLISVIRDEDHDLITRKLGAAVMQKRTEVVMRYRVFNHSLVRWVEDHCMLTYHDDGALLSAGSLLWISTLPLEWHLLRNGAETWNSLNSTVRHDMLNQLTAVLGYLELSQDMISDPTLKDFFEKELNAAERIREKLIFTREYQKIGLYDFEWVKLSSLITEAAGEAGCSRLSLLLSFNLEISLFVDKTFKQAIVKILENIPTHAGNATEIKIQFQEKTSGGVLIIEDNGKGIPAEQKHRLFDLGFGSGDGFGLFLAEEELKVFGIGITESGEPGKCARFELTIPGEIFHC
ncbi:MAG: HAMP domain-containing histidine kinase [Methanospirillum sp.]|uniref:sensor histidine kinase n=1 Tax=Methanospirillum sp. TaxID=45200 RepID=UPI00236A304D|nr:HAMP domain-containing sensor histidine kinase [Methanospirillum sp.]MDD1727752.1 HAMP domain-containing histidine kinase [Methanospirillum sp.]